MSQEQSLFERHLIVLSTQALIAMGLGPNPATGKTSRNLAGAKYTLDVLAMLEEKTAGNLTEAEAAFLTNILYELRLRYFELVAQEGDLA